MIEADHKRFYAGHAMLCIYVQPLRVPDILQLAILRWSQRRRDLRRHSVDQPGIFMKRVNFIEHSCTNPGADELGPLLVGR